MPTLVGILTFMSKKISCSTSGSGDILFGFFKHDDNNNNNNNNNNNIFLLINFEMPTMVGILTLMSRKNFMLNNNNNK